MTSSVISRVTINAKPSDVFKYLADTNYHLLWNPHLQNLSLKRLLKQGDVYETSSLLLGIKVTGRNQVTKFIKNKQLRIENCTGNLRYKVHYHLESDSKPTLLTCKTEVTTQGKTFAFTGPVVKLLAHRELQSDLKALKLAVENKLR